MASSSQSQSQSQSTASHHHDNDDEEMEEDDIDILQTIGDYKPGSIKEIRVTNFLTYGKATIRPGPRLNMVVGPNGTGKSTILNAVCLGLGGEPKLLGRADDCRDYIRHGQDSARLEIDIATDDDNNNDNGTIVTIRRDITKNINNNKAKSTFFLNGKQTPLKQIRQQVSELNIKLDNLCTFLPQDKVGNFSGLSQQQLLVETEKTLDPKFYDWHEQIEKEQAKVDNEQGNVDTLAEKLRKLQHENQALERAKDLMEEREQAMQKADLYHKKRLWLEFESARAQAVELQTERNEIKGKLKESKRQLAPLEQQHQELASEKKRLQIVQTKHQENVQKCHKEIEKQSTKFDTHDERQEILITDITELDSGRATLERNVEKCQERFDNLEEQKVEVPPEDEVNKKLKAANTTRKAVGRQYDSAKKNSRQLEREFNQLQDSGKRLQEKLSRLQDAGTQRRRAVFNYFQNLASVSKWVEDNRSIFRKPVTGPIAAHVNIKDNMVAAYLEQHVPNWLWQAFIVESQEDQALLFKKIREEKDYPINIVVIDKKKPVKRPFSDEKMGRLKRDYGISGYLDEMFTAPDIVRQALRVHAQVEKVLTGNEKTYDNMTAVNSFITQPEAALCQNGLRPYTICCSSREKKAFKFSVSISRYSNKPFRRIDDVSAARFLSGGISPAQIEEVTAQLSNVHEQMQEFRPKMDEAEKKKGEIEQEMQKCQASAEAAKKRKESIKQFMSKYDNQKKKLRDAKEALEAKDDDKEKKHFVTELMNRVKNAVTAIEAHSTQQKKMLEAGSLSTGAAANRASVSAAEHSAGMAYVEKKQENKELEEEALDINNRFKAARALVNTKKTEAESSCPLHDEDGNPTALKDELESLEVTTLRECEVAIEELEQKAEQIDANPEVIRQYEQRKQEIEDLEGRLEQLTSSKNEELGNLNRLKDRYERGMQSNIEKANVLFTKYMDEIGCTGEVVLYKGVPDGEDTENDGDAGDNRVGKISEWGIQILVSFRENQKAVVLSKDRHSGGERSVSTIMYLMALQDMMVSPFRCVDEINQGLDERNERLVFRRIVENSCKEPDGDPTAHSGQYFLITPKLLPNLVDMEEEQLTVLFVTNGPYNFDHPEAFNVEHLLCLANQQQPVGEEEEGEEENHRPRNAVRRPKAKKSRLS